jgi:hypothetical protein
MGGLELEMTGARGDQDKQTVRCFVYTVSMRLSSNGELLEEESNDGGSLHFP